MKKTAYALVSIADQHFGLPVNAIRTIQAYAGSAKVNGKHVLSLSGSDYIIKHIAKNVNSPARKLIVVFNSEKKIALFVDGFQSIEIQDNLLHHLPKIMQSDTSFVHQIFYDNKLEKIIYLCQLDNFCSYLDS